MSFVGGWSPREGSQSEGGECTSSRRSVLNDRLPRSDASGSVSSGEEVAESPSLCEEPEEVEEALLLLHKSMISDALSSDCPEEDEESSSDASDSEEEVLQLLLLLRLRDRRGRCRCLELLRGSNKLVSRTNPKDWSTSDGSGSLALQFAN